jgi:energy-coupling factor transporter transmembrane protein EcfT
MDLPIHVPTALVGQIAVFAAFALVVYALAREAARVVIRILLVAGIVLAIGLFTGLLDQSAIGRILERVGDGMIVAIKAVVGWLTRAWDAVSAKG